MSWMIDRILGIVQNWLVFYGLVLEILLGGKVCVMIFILVIGIFYLGVWLFCEVFFYDLYV